MALESFGTKTAEQINHAVILCHDLLKGNQPERVNEIFKAGDPPIWRVYAGRSSTSIDPGAAQGDPVVIIELGVG